MAIKYRGYHYTWQFFKNTTGGTTQVPASSVTITPYKQGAKISGTITGSAGAQTIPVYDPGAVQVGDTICIDTATTTTAVVGSITATTIVTSSGALLASTGTRVVVVGTTLTGYTDDQLSVSAGTIQTDSTGSAEAYFHEPVLDCIISGTGITTQVLEDQAGSGVWPLGSYFGIKADNTNADTQALRGAIARAIALGQQEILLPEGTILIDGPLTVTGATGLRIRGKGRGLTKLKMTNDVNNLFTIGSGTTDFILEDLDLAGSGSARTTPLVCEISSNTTGTALRRVRLIDAGEGVTFLGTDCTIDDALFSGTRWTYFINISGATRAVVNNVRGRFGAAGTAGVIVQGAHTGLNMTNVDIGSSSGSTAALLVSGSTSIDARFTNCRFSAGTGASAVVVGGGNSNFFTNCIATGSQYGFYIAAGTNTSLVGCQSSLNQRENYYVLGTASHTTITGCKSSDANQAAGSYSHCLIDGGVSNVSIWDFEVGMFTGGVTPANAGVQLADGAGTDIWIGKVFGDPSSVSGGSFIFNQKVNTRTGIYLYGHGQYNDSTGSAYTPEHGGFTMEAREFSTGTTINVDGVNHIHLLYGAPTTVTNFTGGAIGQLLYVTNESGGSTVTFDHNTSLIICANNVDYALAAGDTTVFLKTNTTNTPWKQMVVGTSAVTF